MADLQRVDLAVVIGRFQIDRLSNAHETLIRHAVMHADRTLVLVGCAPTITKRNPLPYNVRSAMIVKHLKTYVAGAWQQKQTHVVPVMDHPDNAVWASQVDGIVSAVAGGGSVRFVWGTQSAHDIYTQHGRYKEHQLLKPIEGRATDRRAAIKADPDSEVFRAGAIWQQERLFVNPWPTVDMVVTENSSGILQVLLGQKDNDGDKWRFPGGFVDVTDLSLEAAARREVREECGDIEVDPIYIGSLKIADWRLRGCQEGIITSVFHCPRQWGEPKAGDDLKRIRWFKWGVAKLYIHPVHQPILELALEKGIGKRS